MLKSRLLSIILTTFSLLALSLTANASTVSQLLHQSGDPVAGNPKGSITLVEFLDYQCSHCVDMHPVVSSLIRSNPNLRVVYKFLPLRGEISDIATKAALAAVKQGKFSRFNNALLASNSLSEKSIFALAKSSGLDVKKLKNDMNSSTVKNLIKANMDLANNLGLQGTPTFFLGKTNTTNFDDLQMILGSVSQRVIQNAINAAGQ